MEHDSLVRLIKHVKIAVYTILVLAVGVFFLAANPEWLVFIKTAGANQSESPPGWRAPDSTAIPNTPEGDLIRYGRELIAHTALYLGPEGKVMQMSNGMNCQNCHLKGGKKIFGNNFSAVAATYPRFRARSGTEENIERRINDCFERSLNGTSLPPDSRELKALIAYISWVGKDVPKEVRPEGAGVVELPLLDRPADTAKGKVVFTKNCVICHGDRGLGLRADNGIEWKYPPLHGPDSYGVSAGMYRLSRFAAFVKANMPDGATHDNPVLTTEEAWDVAAYINSLPRPEKKFASDWPDISRKPFDHPFGPYSDSFSETQHKYGPFLWVKK